MKLAEWARENGIRRDTACEWFHAGILPVPTVQLPTGTILVQRPSVVTGGGNSALYARVPSADRKDDLERQLGRLAGYAAERHLHQQYQQAR